RLAADQFGVAGEQGVDGLAGHGGEQVLGDRVQALAGAAVGAPDLAAEQLQGGQRTAVDLAQRDGEVQYGRAPAGEGQRAAGGEQDRVEPGRVADHARAGRLGHHRLDELALVALPGVVVALQAVARVDVPLPYVVQGLPADHVV